MNRRAMLIILDGYGNNPRPDANAVLSADSPFLADAFRSGRHPVAAIATCGLDVGLPKGQMGNSEVGHMNIGAGRIVYQDLTKISLELENGDFAKNPVLRDAIGGATATGGALHLLGLISDGGVHSHQEHMLGIVKAAHAAGVKRIFLHAFMDGRDTSPNEGKGFLGHCVEGMRAIGAGEVATITGRYYAMDRDKRWERIETAYRALVHAEGERIDAGGIAAAFDARYAKKETDEFLRPLVVCRDGVPVGPIRSGDTVIFFNFRADRAREMTVALNAEDFPAFDRGARPTGLRYFTMTKYEEAFPYPVLYPKEKLQGILGEVVAKAGLAQYRTAETEKYAHVTYFLNGGEEAVFPGEERYLVPSPKVATYDLKPEMSAREVAANLARIVREKRHALTVVNFANCDMVGHTGILAAAQKAVETVDACARQVVEAFFESGGDHVLITADHGNAEQMIDYETGQPFTEHTLFPVPLVLLSRDGSRALRPAGRLADIAPTLLHLLELPVPAEMTGRSLLAG